MCLLTLEKDCPFIICTFILWFISIKTQNRLIEANMYDRHPDLCFHCMQVEIIVFKTYIAGKHVLLSKHKLIFFIIFSPSVSGRILKICETWVAKPKTSREVMRDLVLTVVNSSLREGVVSPSFKDVVVDPLFKKSLPDPAILDNLCPVSKISFLGKVVEKVVAQ